MITKNTLYLIVLNLNNIFKVPFTKITYAEAPIKLPNKLQHTASECQEMELLLRGL